MSLTRRLDYSRLLLRPASLAVKPDPLARTSAFRTPALKTVWIISPPSRANSHPQHRRASQLDRTPAPVSPFGVVPSRSA